jgi:hypothetical protein
MQGESMTAAVLLYDGCTITEVAEIATRLAQWDVRVEYVARKAEELRDQSGLRMLPDRSLDQVDPAGLSAVLVPGGNPDSVMPVWRSWRPPVSLRVEGSRTTTDRRGRRRNSRGSRAPVAGRRRRAGPEARGGA